MAADSVLIVGGGLSGLATAFYLGRAGIRSTMIEKANRVGGLIKTERVEGCDLEAGADSFISTKTAMAELAVDLGRGLSEKIIGSNDRDRRIFVVRKGRLTPMPKAMSMMVPGEWGPALRSPLLSPGAKLRLIRETFTRPRTRNGDFSVRELVSDHFGSEILEYLTEPLLAGVYGGDSASLSARSVLPRFVGFEETYGSLIRGVRLNALKALPDGSLFRSFKGGMQTLIDALAMAVHESSAVIHGEVTKVERLDSGWRVRLGVESISSRQVVLACAAEVSAKLLAETAPAIAGELSAIPYSSSTLAILLYEKAKLTHSLDGFGFLVPSSEQETIAACTWVNTKFPSRVAEGLVALRAFIVGQRAEELSNTSHKEILNAVRKDLARLMGIHNEPIFGSVHAWPKSMPQYVVGHAQRVSRIEAELKAFNGLTLTGNYFDGVGMPDCVRRAKEAAKHIEDKIV